MYAQLLPLALPAPPMPGTSGGFAPPPPMGGMGMPPMPPFGMPPMGYWSLGCWIYIENFCKVKLVRNFLFNDKWKLKRWCQIFVGLHHHSPRLYFLSSQGWAEPSRLCLTELVFNVYRFLCLDHSNVVLVSRQMLGSRRGFRKILYTPYFLVFRLSMLFSYSHSWRFYVLSFLWGPYQKITEPTLWQWWTGSLK